MSLTTKNKVGRLILVRHGQSIWNVTDATRNLTARFTGWTNVGLTRLGMDQASAVGVALRDVKLDCAVCSLLSRAQDTLAAILHESQKQNIPIIHSWRLNERHYGALVGLSKKDAELLHGKEKLSNWRHGWDVRPPPMDDIARMEWSLQSHCRAHTYITDDVSKRRNVRLLEKLTDRRMPASESLQDTCHRVLPLWRHGFLPRLQQGQTILCVAHANTVKAMLYFLDNQVVNEESFHKLKIPSGIPLVYEFENSSSSDDAVSSGLRVIPSSSFPREDSQEFRHQLNGQWIETSEIESTQFCTDEGQVNLEHEIA